MLLRQMLPELPEKAAVQESAEHRARGAADFRECHNQSYTSLARVQRIDLSNMDEDQRESWPQFKKLLEECAKVGIGLCVTFKISTDRHLSSPSSRRTWSRGGRRLRPLPKKDDGGYAGKGPAEIDRCR